jgi:hypothetical protein
MNESHIHEQSASTAVAVETANDGLTFTFEGDLFGR